MVAGMDLVHDFSPGDTFWWVHGTWTPRHPITPSQRGDVVAVVRFDRVQGGRFIDAAERGVVEDMVDEVVRGAPGRYRGLLHQPYLQLPPARQKIFGKKFCSNSTVLASFCKSSTQGHFYSNPLTY